jgi:DNA-binding NarL/FixJ family response regulator
MIGAGAAGYVLKDCAFDELARALRITMANQTYLSPGIAGIVVDGFRASTRATPASVFARLTAREREVAELLVEGCSTKQIADRLKVSAKTVGTHREHLMAKLQVKSIAELTRFAIADGLV